VYSAILHIVKDHAYYLQKAYQVALTSEGFKGKNKTGAVIVVGKKIVATGRNSIKTHPFARTFSRHPDAIYLHAEHDAILKASRKLGDRDWSKARLYVARATKSDFFGLAKPCNGCACAIEHFKINFVCYTLDASEYLSYVTLNRKTDQMFMCQEIGKPE
jgi:deoxycytidylate deaminase